MAIKKIRLGDYIVRSTANNHDLKYGTDLIAGVTSQGVFDTPKGNPIDVDLKPYKIVNNGAFVYNPTRLNLGSIAYRTEGLCIVSHLYMIFYLNDEGEKIIDPHYLYIYFRRDEFRREVSFRNFGSQRPEFNFNDMSEIEILLPDINIQRNFVAVYNSMLANLKSYQSGLNDLKLTIDSLLDRYKLTAPQKAIGTILKEADQRNNKLEITMVHGININKQFMPSIADTLDVNLSKYKVVNHGQFAFSGMQTGRDKCIRIALNQSKNPIIISPAYTVLDLIDTSINPDYVLMWFCRDEIDRLGWFMSDSSIRSNLDLDRFYEMELPIPKPIEQQYMVNIFSVYKKRKELAERIQNQINNIGSILIKGAIETSK